MAVAVSPGEPTNLAVQIRDFCLDSDVRLLVLDSLHSFFDGNENARPHAYQFCRELRSIAHEINGAVVLLAHPSLTGRNTGTGESGSTAWNNAVRSRFYLRTPDAERCEERELQSMKSNYAHAGDKIKLRSCDGFSEATEQHWIDIQAKEREHEVLFLELLRKLTKEGQQLSHKPRSGNYAPRMFSRRKMRFVDAEAAMDRLFDQARILVGQVPGSGRHKVDGIIEP